VSIRKKAPSLYVIAGPNGAGKTTFAKEFLPHYAKYENFVIATEEGGDLTVTDASVFARVFKNVER